MDNPHDWRSRLYVIIFQTDTRADQRFDSWLLLTILASLVVVVVVIIDSIDGIHRDYAQWLETIEWGFTLIFAIEYGLRLYCSPKPLRYAFSFYSLIDLLAIRPGVLALYYADAQYLLIIRVVRMLRIFRILKLSPYLKQANYLLTALYGSKQKIIVFLLTISTLVTVFGALMYVIEGPEHGFTSIPKGIYWGGSDPDHGRFWRHSAEDCAGSGLVDPGDDHWLLNHRSVHRHLHRRAGHCHARRRWLAQAQLPGLLEEQPRARRGPLQPLR